MYLVLRNLLHLMSIDANIFDNINYMLCINDQLLYSIQDFFTNF